MINPDYTTDPGNPGDSTIQSDPNAATIEATIQRAINTFESSFTANVTVNINFYEMNSGLAASNKFIDTETYSAYLTAIKAYAAARPGDADVQSAVASLPAGPNNPVPGDGSTNLSVAVASAIALGLDNSASTSATIGLNVSIMNLDRTGTQNSSNYDLQSAVSHEMDEVLGGGSGLDNLANGDPIHPTPPPPPKNTQYPEPLDLYRYDQNGNRSFDTNQATQAFFSIDGGKTDLVGFNQYSPVSGTDFGDWFSNNGAGNPTNPQVQDSNASPGTYPDLGVELRRLDVLGFARVNTPAPVITAPANQTSVEGTTQTFNLGSFTDSECAPFGVTVRWGDGNTDKTL